MEAGLAYKRLDIDSVLKGKYVIKDYLTGGKSELTYLAVDLGLNRKAVIKGFELDGKIDQALEEAQNICQFESEFIVVVYEHFTERGVSYHATRYHPKGSLQDKLDSTAGGVLDESEVRQILSDLVEGMKVVHAKNILHTDLKPQNVVFSDKNAVIIDFDTAVKNNHVAIAYTAGYASPEQDLEEKLDKRADIYALGAIAHHCLTGQKPTKAIDRNTHDNMEKLGDREGASDFLKSIDRALSLDKSKRPESVTAWKNSWGKEVEKTSIKPYSTTDSNTQGTAPKGRQIGRESGKTRDKDNSRATTVNRSDKSKPRLSSRSKAVIGAAGVVLVGTGGTYAALNSQPIDPTTLSNEELVEIIEDKSKQINSIEEAESLLYELMNKEPTEQQKTESINSIAQGRLAQAKQYAQKQQWDDVMAYAQQGIDLGVDGNLKVALKNEFLKAKAQLDAIQYRKDLDRAKGEKDKGIEQKLKKLHGSVDKESTVR